MSVAPRKLLEIKNLSFSYKGILEARAVISDLDLEINQGDYIAIQGPSGSGKSTLFHLIGCLLRPTSGVVRFNGQDVTRLNDDELGFFRNQNIGFVFQQFHLLPKATVLDNILLPALYPVETSVIDNAVKARATQLAKRLGIDHLLAREPNQLSGGQQQRVAITRALMQDPDLILADEPTGNLDSKSAMQAMDLFDDLNRQGKTIVIITHDPQTASRCHKVIHFKDGKVDRIDDHRKPSSESTPTKLKGLVSYKAPDSFVSTLKRVRASAPMALANLLRHKMKTFLTMMGVIIGIAAVLSMISLGNFAKGRILETYERLGVNKFELRGHAAWNLAATDKIPGTPFTGFEWNRDLKGLKDLFPEILYLSPQKEFWAEKYSYNGRTVTASDGVSLNFRGVGPEFFAIANTELHSGKLLSPFHVESLARVCVIGSDVGSVFGKSSLELLDQIVTFNINDRTLVPCKVIGVLKPRKGANGTSKFVFLPYSTALSFGNIWDSKLSDIMLSVRPGFDVEEVGLKVKNYFKKRYGKSGNFYVDSDSVLLAQMKRFLNIFNSLLAAIAFLSLLVGGIGIHNMMLVSISDRLKEIGLRKALGATNKSIRALVLSESVMMCSFAGLIGVIFGVIACQAGVYAATKLVKTLTFEWVFDPFAIGLASVSIVAVGILSGLAPALKAEALEVIEALRSD
ncbi:MAG: ATP-binding cassette domain-containing protein [Proteobacteria bacterium]|nr:ATP-binding cassette domain-containing protein [Pseudomonadota bacterium]